MAPRSRKRPAIALLRALRSALAFLALTWQEAAAAAAAESTLGKKISTWQQNSKAARGYRLPTRGGSLLPGIGAQRHGGQIKSKPLQAAQNSPEEKQRQTTTRQDLGRGLKFPAHGGYHQSRSSSSRSFKPSTPEGETNSAAGLPGSNVFDIAAKAAATRSGARAQAAPAQTNDPCTALFGLLRRSPNVAGSVYTQPRAVLPCTQSVRFNPSRDLGTLRSILLYLQHFYSLLHIAKASPDPLHLPSSYNVVTELKKVAIKNWTSAEDFYTAVASAVDGLNDGHTSVQTNCPPFQHALALPLVGVVENGVPTVRVAPTELISPDLTRAAKSRPFNFNAAWYHGAKVLSIQGMDAWSYMLQWIHRHPTGFHDPGQQLNAAFASANNGPGAFALRAANPRSNSIKLRLLRDGSSASETVDVPWLSVTSADNLQGFVGQQTYYTGFCAPADSTGDSAVKASATWQTLLPNAGGRLGMRKGNDDDTDRALGSGEWQPGNLQAEPELLSDGFTVAVLQENSDTGGGAQRAGIGSHQPRPSSSHGRPASWSTFDYTTEGSSVKLGQGRSQGRGSAPQLKFLRKKMRRVRTLPPHLHRLKASIQTQTMDGSQSAQGTLISAPADFFPVFLLKDQKTGVVALRQFSVDDVSIADPLGYILEEAIKAFSLAAKYSSQVIIDLSGNSGGYVQVATWLVTLLVGSDKFPVPRSTMQADFMQLLAETKLVVQLLNARSKYYDCSNYATTHEVQFNASDCGKFFWPIQSRTFGANGDAGRYSSLFKIPLTSLEERVEASFGPILGTRPFLLLTDGLCFSTCSTFANTMARRFGVPLVSSGGIPQKPMAFSAAGGGFVLDDVEQEMLPSFSEQVASRPDAPHTFGFRLQLALRLANGFFNSTAPYPTEFTFLAASKSISYSLDNLKDPNLLYSQAAKFF